MNRIRIPTITNNEKNWAGNYQYTAETIHYPETIEQAREIVSQASQIKPLGSRHSFNDIADCDQALISLEKLPPEIEIDGENQQVTITANVRYGELADTLHQHGFALHNLASLPHISVVGACATATHGSGVGNGNLATAVSALEFINANGTLKTLSRQDDTFPGAVVSLGGLGLITRLTLDIQPTFNISQTVYRNLPFTTALNHFDDIMSSAYSVSLFTDWSDDTINQVWVKRLADTPAADFPWATPATVGMHPIDGISAVNCTAQLAVPGPWHTRLPHFRMDFTPSSGQELQSEYFIPRTQAPDALAAIAQLSPRISPLLHTSEIRTITADNLWMSPNYQQDSVAIHLTWKQDWPTVKALLPAIEAALMPFNVRPHWAKLFTLSPTILQSRYQKLSHFRHLLQTHDPTAKFRNDFLNANIFS